MSLESETIEFNLGIPYPEMLKWDYFYNKETTGQNILVSDIHLSKYMRILISNEI